MIDELSISKSFLLNEKIEKDREYNKTHVMIEDLKSKIENVNSLLGQKFFVYFLEN